MQIASIAARGLGAVLSASYAASDTPSTTFDVGSVFVLDHGQPAQ